MHSQLPAVEDGPAQRAADDVFFLVRAGIDVLVDRQRAGPHVVGDPPEPPPLFAGRARTSPMAHVARGHARSAAEMSMLKIRIDPLQHRGGPLEPLPVSMFFSGSGREVFGGLPTRLNWVKTRFQISTSPPPVGGEIDLAARAADAVGPLAGGAGGPEVISSSPSR